MPSNLPVRNRRRERGGVTLSNSDRPVHDDERQKMTTLLEVKDLVTQFKTEGGLVKAVNGVTYYIDEQEIVGLVGESGCGKSVSQLSVMQLIRAPGEIAAGEITFEGQNLLEFE